MSWIQALGDTRLINQYQRLPDLFLEILPHPNWLPRAMADIVLNAFCLVSLIVTIMRTKNPLQRIRRVFWIFGTCYVLRSISLLGTTLPPSHSTCIPKPRTILNILFVLGPKLLIGTDYTCTDKIFSGHTCLATLLFWSWIWDSKSLKWKIYSTLHALSVIIASLSCQHHYTVDVTIAFMISSMLYFLYRLGLMLDGESCKFSAIIHYVDGTTKDNSIYSHI